MSRRRYKTRSQRIRALIIVLGLFVAITFSLIFSNVTGKFSLLAFIIIFFSFIIGFSILFFIFSLPSVRGKMGESKVSKRLTKLANKYGGYVIDDVIIPGENDKTSQIDHIYVSNYGLYVVETKNYSGRIYGNDKQREWTQVLAYGNTKNKLYNPVMQNQTHIYRLLQLLKAKVNAVSVVVFVRGNVDYIESDYVFDLYGLKHLLDDARPCIDDATVERILNIIMEYKANPTKSNKEHVKEIKQMQRDLKQNICPRCGGELVLRQSRTGSMFYGCSNYPKCKFIKKQ